MKFFISYAIADRDYASLLAAEIQRKGGTVSPDEGDLIGVNNAIFEAGAAKALGKKVFVVSRGAADRELPSSIADFAIFDAENKPLQEIAGALVRHAA